MFVNWKEENVPYLNIKEIAITEDMFNKSIKVEFEYKCGSEIGNYINKWYNTNTNKSLILSWYTNNIRGFYYFENGFPNLIRIDNNGNLKSFKFKFEKCYNISRQFKIKMLLNSNKEKKLV